MAEAEEVKTWIQCSPLSKVLAIHSEPQFWDIKWKISEIKLYTVYCDEVSSCHVPSHPSQKLFLCLRIHAVYATCSTLLQLSDSRSPGSRWFSWCVVRKVHSSLTECHNACVIHFTLSYVTSSHRETGRKRALSPVLGSFSLSYQSKSPLFTWEE
jgi:hypothetical protein